MLSGITHDHPLIQSKVRYLSDYFDATVYLYGKIPQFHTDNHLFLLDELCFYLLTLDYAVPYVDSIFTHPLWTDIEPLKCYTRYPAFVQIMTDYNGLTSNNSKKTYLERQKQNILAIVRPLRGDLQRNYLRSRLNEVISYLGCTHALDHHLSSLNEAIRTIVSILILRGHHEKDLLGLFDRIMHKDPKQYPFPKKLTNSPIEKREEYLRTLSFREQFQSLRYATQKPKQVEYFIFRCFGIKAPAHFDVEYDSVQFLHADNVRFNKIKGKLPEEHLGKDFFKAENCVYAVVMTKNNYTDAGARIALSIVRTGVEHLKAKIGDGFHLDSTSYLTTSDFVEVGWKLSYSDGITRLTNQDVSEFRTTAFALLKPHNTTAKKDFLRHERVFSRAAVSFLPSDFWVYAEVLYRGHTPKEIQERFARVSAIDQSRYTLNRILRHLHNLISPFYSNHESLGITREQYDEMYLLLNDDDALLPWLEANVNVPIVRRMVEYARIAQASVPDDYVEANRRTWIQAYGQRNSFVHKNEFHEGTLLTSMKRLPSQVQRIRTALVAKMIENQSLTLTEVIQRV